MSTTIQIHFGPSKFENPREELLKLKQSSSVHAYFDAFNDLAVRVCDMDDVLLLDCFVGGLHPDLKREVKSRSAASLMQVVSLAKLFEEKYMSSTQRGKLIFPHIQPQLNRSNTMLVPKPVTTIPNLHSQPPLPPLLPTPPKPGPVRKLSPVEIQFRQDKGLCFTCDEKYSPSHKCTTKHYFLIQSMEEIPLEQLAVEDKVNIEPSELDIELQEETLRRLSYNALTGMSARRSIWFSGTVHGRQL